MLQNIDGVDVYVVVLTNDPLSYIPISDDGDRFLRPYADALQTAILTGVINSPGKYGIQIDHATNRWNAFAIQE